jgi:hypothetical protein
VKSVKDVKMHLILTDILHHSQQAIKTAWKFVDTNLENRGGEGGGAEKRFSTNALLQRC